MGRDNNVTDFIKSKTPVVSETVIGHFDSTNHTIKWPKS